MILDRFVGLDVRKTANAVRFSVKVQPRASRNEIVGVLGGALKVKLTAPPVDGAANAALIELFSSELGVPKRKISIISGESARTKVVQVLNT